MDAAKGIKAYGIVFCPSVSETARPGVRLPNAWARRALVGGATARGALPKRNGRDVAVGGIRL